MARGSGNLPHDASFHEDEDRSDQGQSKAFDDRLYELFQEIDGRGEQYPLLRWLTTKVGEEKARIILADGVGRLWEVYLRSSPDMMAADEVNRLLWTICRNIVYGDHRKYGRLVSLNHRWRDSEGNEREWELECPEVMEDSVLQQMHDRDLVEKIRSRFSNDVDKACIDLYLIQKERPSEIAKLLRLPIGPVTKRCSRLKERVRKILLEMGLQPKEVDPGGG